MPSLSTTFACQKTLQPRLQPANTLPVVVCAQPENEDMLRLLCWYLAGSLFFGKIYSPLARVSSLYPVYRSCVHTYDSMNTPTSQ